MNKIRSYLPALACIAYIGVFSVFAHAEPYYIDHFEKSGNLVGGRTSVYEQAPSSAVAVSTDREFFGPAGKSLVIKYDKKNTGGPYGGGGWCGYYSLLKTGDKYFNASAFKVISFYVKGEKGGENFKVGLADKHWEGIGDTVKSESIGAYLEAGEVTTDWQKAAISLSVFFLDLKELASFTIGFENDCFPEGMGRGIVYIDEVMFE
ncbi:MAG: hypothetical protein ABH825_03000 [Candidatus Omnitrophota bacterium]